MSFIEGTGRDQQTLFPAALDDYIAAENPVRFIDAYVDALDLESLGFERATGADAGRPGYHGAHSALDYNPPISRLDRNNVLRRNS